MKKKDLMSAAKIIPSTMDKLGKDEYVSVKVLAKVCHALSVDIGDIIMEITPSQNDSFE